MNTVARVMFIASILVSLLLVANSADAQSLFYYRVIGKPVTLSVRQAPEGFWESLQVIDKGNGYISDDKSWRPFWSSDVWVYFIGSPSELRNFSEVEKAAAEYKDSDSTMDFAKIRQGEVSGKQVMIMFINMSKLERERWSEAGCRAAFILYEEISGTFDNGREYGGIDWCVTH